MGDISAVGPLHFNNAAVFMEGNQNEDAEALRQVSKLIDVQFSW
jgi:hypothetical protein